MNINVLLGIISFTVWSAFSTWYYVTYIKQFYDPAPTSTQIAVAEPEPEEATTQPTEEPHPAETISETIVEPEATAEEKSVAPAPINVTREVLFFKNTTDPVDPSELQAFLNELSELLNSREVVIEVTGHGCDLGTEAHNLALGRERAEYIAKRIRSSLSAEQSITIYSKGESSPAVPNSSESERAKNRRATITINTSS